MKQSRNNQSFIDEESTERAIKALYGLYHYLTDADRR